MRGGVGNAYYHYAAFHGYEYGSWVDYLASCFSYVPQHRVPPGEQHKVSINEGKVDCDKIMTFKITAWHVPRHFKLSISKNLRFYL